MHQLANRLLGKLSNQQPSSGHLKLLQASEKGAELPIVVHFFEYCLVLQLDVDALPAGLCLDQFLEPVEALAELVDLQPSGVSVHPLVGTSLALLEDPVLQVQTHDLVAVDVLFPSFRQDVVLLDACLLAVGSDLFPEPLKS